MLAAFEAAARHQSFTAAANELALTASALGRQVSALQELVGVPLFRRTRHGIALTEAGQAYQRHVVRALDDMERELRGLRGRGGTLELGVVPSFGVAWLVPRLPRLRERAPDLELNLASRTRPFLFQETGLDAAIHAGPGAWPGTQATFLMPERVVPVCSPALVAPGQRLTPAELAQLPLLQQGTRPEAWRTWFAAAGVTDVDALAGPRFELFSMSLQAAVAGLGVALVPDFLAEPDEQAGRLVRPVDASSNGLAYWLVTPADRPDTPAVTVLRQWLLDECAPFRPAARP